MAAERPKRAILFKKWARQIKTVQIKTVQENNSVTFLPDNINIGYGEPAPTILDLAIYHELSLNHSCGGMGTCGTCRVVIESETLGLPARNEIEDEMAKERGFQPEERLACQTCVYSGMRIRIP